MLSRTGRASTRSLRWATNYRLPADIRRAGRLRSQPRSHSTSSPPYRQEHNPKPKPGGSYTKILATFSLGIPLGFLLRSLNPDNEQIAKPTDFVKYQLVSKDDVSSTCSLFTLRPSGGPRLDHEQIHDARALTSVQFKQPQLQIARAYTVFPPTTDQAPDDLRFLIRKEKNGEMSRYLHRLPLLAEVEIRGPSTDFSLPDEVSEVLFLAGGTGIAPAMQVAQRLSGKADVHVLWACRRREDCAGGVSDAKQPPRAGSSWFPSSWTSSGVELIDDAAELPANTVVRHIRFLKQPPDPVTSKLLIDYFVDEEGTQITPSHVAKLLHSGSNNTPGTRLLLISGPDGFVNHWAGPKEWLGGREVQGRLGGELGEVDLGGWRVVKL
ncbi:hypothetical protein LTR62_008810 [Meristemomyces frigidus]|uniref:FAD-binding FR-type domain-containing protein n=1 Tax=Meristemomyces frigidus TaxID=1508187 RepID=A0AAN7YN15_9PEZI|nr:hypothetical protein LTR62_008810 [Meristemomyces frigidus]